jgi:hypothetical protein
MRTSSPALAAILVGALATTIHAQDVQVQQMIQVSPPDGGQGLSFPPNFMQRPQFKTGSGRMRGRVLQADGSGPVRRAQVRLMSAESGPKSAITDVQGRFDVRDLPAGRYTITANKSGFMPVQYGQTRPFESGKPIELADKQTLDNVDLAMPRGGSISGRILDEFGDPMPDTGITVMRLGWSNGKRRLTPVPGRGWPTDDLGHYRVYGLPPGEYYVSAMRGNELQLLSTMPDPIQGINVGFGSGFSLGSSTESRSGYATTFFPGTPNQADAQRVTVTAGQDSSNIDFQLTAVRLAKVSGFVMNSEGRPAGGTTVTLISNARDGALGDQNSARTGQDGSFSFSNVAPGDYVLRAEAVQTVTSTTPQGDGVMVFRASRIGGADGPEMEGGSIPVAVSGEDLSSVTLITSKGARATGRVVLDGEPKPAMTSIRLTSVPLDLAGGNSAFGGAMVKEDGTFELKGLFGTRMILPIGPPGWMLRSIKANGTDITDSGAEFKPGESYSLEVEMTRRATTITGGVTAGDGTAVKDYTAVIFPENADLWRLPRSRWVTGTRPDQDGRFKVANLPAGNYYAAAVEYVPTGEWADPEVLDRLKSHAKRFTLDEGASQTLDLKLTAKY